MPSWNAHVAHKTIWAVVSPGRVYRYLEREFVDLFLETGKLRLSSFSRFKDHLDEDRNDPDEGRGHLQGVGKRSGFLQLGASLGRDAYILSTSARLDEDLFSGLPYDGCFEISNVAAFGLAVAKEIPGFRVGKEGHCIYAAHRVIGLESEVFELDVPRDNQLHAAEDAAEELLFLKHKRYAHQAEYRMIWHTSEEVSGTLDIQSEEAVSYCRRVPPRP
jgi:hypothetical protein